MLTKMAPDGQHSIMPGDRLRALDLVRGGHVHRTRQLTRSRSDERACLIHAYMHRAGVNMHDDALEAELNRLYRLERNELEPDPGKR
jgi:hypothetical protein